MSRALEIAQEVDDWFAEDGHSYSRKAWYEKFYTLARADLEAENAALWEDREDPLKQVALYLSECNRLERERDAVMTENARLHEKLDALLAHCPDGECMTCGEIICDHKDPMHFHHDGCPSC